MTVEIVRILNNKNKITDDELSFVICEKDNLFFLEKELEDSSVDVYMYNFSGSSDEFDVDILEQKLNNTDSNNNVELFVLFKDWKHERAVYSMLYSNGKTGKEKKTIVKIFSEIISVYQSSLDNVVLEVDEEGINYLEIKSKILDEKDIEAMIYNLTFKELEKLFNVTGTELFSLNVRYGIENKKSGRDLREKFKTYLKVALINLENFKDNREEIITELALTNHELETFLPSRFWYSHNGVNIFLNEEAKFKTNGSKISFDPTNVSVINGAQTLTNFFLATEEFSRELKMI